MPASRFKANFRESCVPLFGHRPRPNPSTVDAQLFCFHIFTKTAAVNSFESHTSKKSRINIKTNGFKPFRIIFLRGTIPQVLLNHILTKTGGGGGVRAIGARQNNIISGPGLSGTAAAVQMETSHRTGWIVAAGLRMCGSRTILAPPEIQQREAS